MQNKTLNYKGVRVNAFGIPVFRKSSKYEDKRPRKGNRNSYHFSFVPTFKKDAPKNLIVMYDISEDQKKERDWFRRHLIKFGYIMIQKSVWVGPSPLPKNFLDYLKDIDIGDNFRTFKLAKPYNSAISAIA